MVQRLTLVFAPAEVTACPLREQDALRGRGPISDIDAPTHLQKLSICENIPKNTDNPAACQLARGQEMSKTKNQGYHQSDAGPLVGFNESFKVYSGTLCVVRPEQQDTTARERKSVTTVIMQTPRRTHVPRRERFGILEQTCIDAAPPTTSQRRLPKKMYHRDDATITQISPCLTRSMAVQIVNVNK